jgi:hypothetical protein
MELSISTLTANRQLGKAVIRVSPGTRRLKELVSDVQAEKMAFEILQVILSDEPPATVKPMPSKRGSRVLQVKVGLPEGLTFRPEMDRALLEAIADRVIGAVEAVGVSPSFVGNVREAVEAWKREIAGERFDH